MTKTRTTLLICTGLAIGAWNLSVSAQPNGPGTGGMMGGGGGWGMSWGMGGFGGVGLLVVVLLVGGLVFAAVRRRNS